MRVKFKQQLELGVVPINEVKIDMKGRHSLGPLLYGLQYSFKTPEISDKLFKILDDKVLKDIKKTGRNGMSLWEILVLGVVRLNLNIDYDFLWNLTNSHEEIRGILGIQRSDFRPGRKYSLQTIKDNVSLLDEETILKVVDVIAKGGQDLIVKKKGGKASLNLDVKADSFVVESDIHFPTDISLLWDSVRKCTEMIGYFRKQGLSLTNWREWKYWRNRAQSAYRETSEIHRKGGKHYPQRLKTSTTSYLDLCRTITKKVSLAISELSVSELVMRKLTSQEQKKLKDLKYYLTMLDKHIDLVNRRIILGETIPHSEKVFSIFESHVEWNSKGKAGAAVELGHNVLVATDQYGFILHIETYVKTVDSDRTQAIGKKIIEAYNGYRRINSLSFDKNFYSKPAEDALKGEVKILFLPKAGRKSKTELENEENASYKKVKKGHSKIEGNINELEHHGLDICRDKGLEGFKRYIAYGALSLNFTKLGRLVYSYKLKEIKRLEKRKLRRTA